VRLVDDEQLVRGYDVPPGQHVDGEQAVVGDHDVGLPGPGARRLGEALRAVRAAGRPHALACRHGDLPPGRVVDTGIQLVAVAGLALQGPLVQPLDLLAQPAGLAQPLGLTGGTGLEERVRGLLLAAGLQPGQADVMVPAFEHGEGGPPAEQRLGGISEAGQVVVDQLGLQGQGRRGDHHRPVDQQGRDQVGQRLAGTGARLDEQVLAALGGLGHGGDHGLLPGPGGAARHGLNRGGQKLLNPRLSHGS
jgi:hypothetical protein